MLKNFLKSKDNFHNMKFVKHLSFLVILLSLVSCYSVKKNITDSEVYLYKGQAHFLNGTYFIDPYETNGDYKLLTDIFDLKTIRNLDKVNFKFIDDQTLKVTYSNGFETYSKTIEGKMKNGAFRYEYKNLPIGVPLFLFNYNFKVHQIALGNDDNMVITEYEHNKFHFILLGIMRSNTTEKRYYFDRQLK